MAELKELLEDEEAREQLFSYVREQGYKAPDEIDGLVRKKDELLEKLAKTKKSQLSESQKAILDAIQDAGFDSAEDLQEALSGKQDTGKVDRDLKKLQRQLEELQSKYDGERNTRLSIEKDRAIDKAMDKAGIRPDARDLVRAYFDRKARVEESENGVSIIAQDDDGLSPPIDEYIESWAKSDQGKNYVQKPMNVGAGVAGGGDVATKTVFTRQELSDPKIAKQVMARKKGGEAITIEG
jgi:DNA primase catalytic subunit